MIELDANGLSCPEPVILLKKALQQHDAIRLLVDNEASAKICARFAASKEFTAETNRVETGYALIISK